MKYQLSVICPGIRNENWIRLYDSIEASFNGSWEIIFVGPYPLPLELVGVDNVKYRQDWGSPIRCQQLALEMTEGQYVNWAADDGVFLPGALTIGFKLAGEYALVNQVDPNHVVIMGKYYEGNNDGDMPMQDTKYYVLSNHDATKSPFIPKDYLMLNVGLVPRRLLISLGGWDAKNFEVCPMAYNDLAIRLQRFGCHFVIQDEMMFRCSHLPGHAGDHGPIHDAQIYFDQPRFSDIYSHLSCESRIAIDLRNWEYAPARWERRFGKQ